MKSLLLLLIAISLTGTLAFAAEPPAGLPDDYLPFTLVLQDLLLTGESEYLPGFTLNLKLSCGIPDGELSDAILFAAVRVGWLDGHLSYPNGRTTPVTFELLRHRSVEIIYMKTSLGYFLWEYLTVEKDRVNFAIYWWYCPPATSTDLAIIARTRQLLTDSTRWHQTDDRDCEDDVTQERWSLFCALKHASLELAGEYNHHNTALQTARFVIDEYWPEHGFEHALMDFNNAPTTEFADVLCVLTLTEQRLEWEVTAGTGAQTRSE